MSVDFNRRNFLKTTAAAGITLSLPSFTARAAETFEALSEARIPAYNSWQDIYREQWTWDSVVRATHLVNCWYQSSCVWDVYVKDGIVFREEQAADYPQVNPNLPDFNPRGCQKGACFSERMYDASRVRHPLRRVGPRGSGRWERVSWDEALDDIANTYLDVTLKEGTDRTIWDMGPTIDFATTAAGMFRFSNLTRSIVLDVNTEIGDGHRGAMETFGKMVGDRSADDYFYSDLILIWGCNPTYTQIPQAHFFNEARYNGARIITITPDYNASAIHADLWIPVNPGTDAALALSVAHVLIEKALVDRKFILEQTDLPLLVREDTGHFLTEADLQKDGGDNRYLLLDEASGEIKQAPWRSLALDGLKPALEVSRKLRLRDGSEVRVQSVYTLLRERLKDYTPAKASKICGTSPKLIRRLAKEIANAKAMSNPTSSCLNKYYHGNLMERSIILLFVLTGQMGRKGAGYSAFPFLALDGTERFGMIPNMQGWDQMRQQLKPMIEDRIKAGDTMEMITYDMARTLFEPGSGASRVTCSALFWGIHAGIIDLADQISDPFVKRSVKEHVQEALDKNWQSVQPAPGRQPRIIFSMTSNPLRRIRASHKIMENLWPQLRLSVVLDFRMNSTAQHADYVLPCAAWYERTSYKWSAILTPYYTMSNAAVQPLGESKPDWAIIALLAKRIQQLARKRGIGTIKSPQGEDVHLDRLYDDFTMNGKFTEDDDAQVMKAILDLSSNLENVTWEELKEKGFARYTSIGEQVMTIGNMCEIPEHDSITPYTFHVRDKVPYPTATRRIQFYLDHPLYMELDEVLPRHKDSPDIGGKYPLMLTGGHPRESIHASWRDDKIMLQLTRGEPFLLMSPEDAAARRINDTDWVRVYNDVGEFVVRIKLMPSMRPGQTLIYHAWENYQFPKGSMRHVTPTPINPVELAGGHPHLRPCYAWGQPSFFDRDTRIDIERLSEKDIRELGQGVAI